MTNEEHPPEAEFEEASNKLSEGLRCCRAVVANYRSMLEGETGSGEQADSDLYQFAGGGHDPGNVYGSGSAGERQRI